MANRPKTATTKVAKPRYKTAGGKALIAVMPNGKKLRDCTVAEAIALDGKSGGQFREFITAIVRDMLARQIGKHSRV